MILVAPDRVARVPYAIQGQGSVPVRRIALLGVAEVTQMLEVRFPVEMVGDVPVVTTPEEVDMTNATGLRVALLDAAGDDRRQFVVDMTRTRFCDSAGIHVLAAAHRRALDERRQMLLVIPGAAVLRVFAIAGVDRIIPNFASLEEALGHADRTDGSQ
ncbi:MAG: STAS domain-containing protein, partial [Trebonia sp.]